MTCASIPMLDGWDSTLVKRWLSAGPIQDPMLSIRSIKLYADGALGSRGAWLLKPYDDNHHHRACPHGNGQDQGNG
ncbi:MAG: hypothetical protein R3B47_14750 [Bacteroidia bacterium]